jgi:hypothetical protein
MFLRLRRKDPIVRISFIQCPLTHGPNDYPAKPVKTAERHTDAPGRIFRK